MYAHITLCAIYDNLTIYTTATKSSLATTEFNWLSSAAYEDEILHSEQKILVKISWCNLHSHGRFLQARSQLLVVNDDDLLSKLRT